MSVQAEGRFWSGIDVPKTIAGTLAAVSAAVLGSFLGVAGTIIGAALASAISSIGTEIYHRSINHSTRRLQSAFVIAPAAAGTPSVEAAADASPSGEETGHDTETDQADSRPTHRIRWKRVTLVAGAFFVLGLGVLTTAEMFAGRSAADVTSGRDSGGPTITFDIGGERDGSDDRDTDQRDTDGGDTDRRDVEQRQPATAPSARSTDSTPAPGSVTGTAVPPEPAPLSEGPTTTLPPETSGPGPQETGTGAADGAAPKVITGESGG